MPPDRCAALADRLAGVAVPDAPDPVVALADIVLRTAVTAVHPPGTGWRAEWLAQLRLSTLALAISFTTFTNLGAKARWWFYRLAARIGRDLLESRRVPIPDTGHEVSGNPFHLPASVSSTAPVPVPAGAVPIQRLVARAWTAMPGTDPGPDELLRTAGEEIHRTGTDAERAVHLQRALLIDATRILGENDPTVLSLMHDLAYWLGRAGRTVASVRTYREVAQRRARQLGPRHPDTEHSWACSRAFGLGG